MAITVIYGELPVYSVYDPVEADVAVAQFSSKKLAEEYIEAAQLKNKPPPWRNYPRFRANSLLRPYVAVWLGGKEAGLILNPKIQSEPKRG